jgi:hypothetical protein
VLLLREGTRTAVVAIVALLTNAMLCSTPPAASETDVSKGLHLLTSIPPAQKKKRKTATKLNFTMKFCVQKVIEPSMLIA